jgi:multidrug resistance efflux pump
MKKKIIALIATLGLLGILSGCGGNAVHALPADRPAINAQSASFDRIIVRGVVESVTSRNIYATLSTNIEQVNVAIGDFVEAGQVLAVLNTDELTLAIAQQRAAIDITRQNSQIAVRDGQRMLNEAAANLANNTNMHILNAQSALSFAQMNLTFAQGEANPNILSAEAALAAAQMNLGFLEGNNEAAIAGAESALNATRLNLTAAHRSHEIALADYEAGRDAHVLGARLALSAAQDNHNRLQIMYNAGFLPREELRQSQITLDMARDAYSNAVQSEQRILEQLEIALQMATAAYQDAQVQLKLARTTTEQNIEMLTADAQTAEAMLNIAKVVSEQELEMFLTDAANAQTMLTATRAAANQEIESLRDMVAISQLSGNVEHMEAALAHLERQLEQATITAPISGTITQVYAREGAMGIGLMFVIEDIENLRVLTSFREYDISIVEVGMPVAITSDGTGAIRHEGVITRINPSAIPDWHIVEFEAEITVLSQNTGLRIGMTTAIEIDFEGR